MAHQEPVLETRKATFEPESFDAEARTVDLVWTTGATVKRNPFFGEPYDEALSLDEGAVRLGRLNSGAPFLAAHDGHSLDSVIGVVVEGSARIEGGQGHATVRLTGDESAASVVGKIRDGIIRNVSVGYEVHEYEVTEKEGQRTLRTAVDWEPYEISAVPMPADAGAQFRGGAPAKITPPTESTMSEQTTPTPAPKPVDLDAERAAAAERAVTAERARVSEIRTLGERYEHVGVTDTEVRAWCEDPKMDAQAVKDAILERMADSSEQDTVGSHVRIEAGDRDANETRSNAIVNALEHRANPNTVELTEPAREYRNLSLMDLCRDALTRQGIQHRHLAPMQVAKLALEQRGGMHATGDFPLLLAAVANKSLQRGYMESPRTFMPIARQVSVNDFKTQRSLQLGEHENLELVPESGAFKEGTITESQETWSIATYGKIFSITRQAMINDDLDSFSRVPMLMGQAASRLESTVVWAIITNNAAMADGVAIFHASHSNLVAAAAALSATSLNATELLVETQTGLDGATLIDLDSEYLVIPRALKFTAETLFGGSYVPTSVGNATPEQMKARYRDRIITERRLDAVSTTAFYTVASPSQIDGLIYAYLRGQTGPYTEQETGFDVDGVRMKIRHDFGAAMLNHRGWARNDGA